MKSSINTRAFHISSLVLVFFSIVCTRIPLLNYLGFEFSVFTVLIAGYISGILTLVFWRRAELTSKKEVWKFGGQSVSVSLVLLLLPLLISLANALFVKNCSIGDGMILYGLTVIPGVFFSISLAMLVGSVSGRWQKTFFSLCYLLILFHIPIVTYFRPQIFAFNPIVGFFPGFTYDESLQITQRLFVYRMATIAGAMCITALAIWLWQKRQNKSRIQDGAPMVFPVAEIVTLALLCPIVLVIFIFSDRLGLSSSKEFIQQKLVGNYKTEHFEIIYPAGSVKREKIEQLARLHEFYFQEISGELELQSQERVASFIYASPEQKGRLIGAANTDIAKPWLRQLHINLADIEQVLKHELTHVLASEFGWSPLKAARNSGLIEGLAVAMERTSVEEPLDRAAALVFAAGLNPHIESLFSMTGFFSANASVSYTLAGAFCRSLIDSFGVEKFKRFYQTGNVDAVYHQDILSLLAAWQDAIKQLPLHSQDTLKAAYFFRRPSIFGKECARVLANINAETKDLLSRHEYEKALASAERSLALSKTPDAVFRKSAALFELQKYHDVILFIEKSLLDSSLNRALLPIRLRLGDAYWAIDSIAQAARQYEYLAGIHLSSWYDEAIALRMECLQDETSRSVLRQFFVLSMEDTVRIEKLKHVTHPAAQYLLAREYTRKERYTESIDVLQRLTTKKSPMIEFLRLQHIGRAYYFLMEWEKARESFEKALRLAPTPSTEMTIKEWIERCQFCAH